MQLSFKEIKNIIIKCCTVGGESEDLSSRFEFSVDLVKMQNMFKQKKNYLFIIGGEKKLNSRIPLLVEDFQLMSEYALEKDDIKTVFNGSSQICSFMIFSKAREDGIIELHNEEDEIYTDKQLFEMCNTNNGNSNLIATILRELPMYRIVVERFFNGNSDKFEYKVFIRSNRDMINYFKFISENPDFLEKMEEEENVETAESNVEESIADTTEADTENE